MIRRNSRLHPFCGRRIDRQSESRVEHIAGLVSSSSSVGLSGSQLFVHAESGDFDLDRDDANDREIVRSPPLRRDFIRRALRDVAQTCATTPTTTYATSSRARREIAILAILELSSDYHRRPSICPIEKPRTGAGI